MMTTLPVSVSKPQPGAVPASFGKTVHPLGSMACLYWFSPQ